MMKKIIFIFFFNFLISDVSEGIVLLPDFQQDVIVLININNEIINSWEVPGLIKAYLNPDSTIYTISRNNDNNFSMQLLNWGGESLWSYLLLKDICRLHHELKITPSGTLLCLCRETILAEDNLFFDGDLNIDKDTYTVTLK